MLLKRSPDFNCKHKSYSRRSPPVLQEDAGGHVSRWGVFRVFFEGLPARNLLWKSQLHFKWLRQSRWGNSWIHSPCGDFRMRLVLERHLCFYQQNPSCPSVAKTNTFTGLHVDSRSCLGCQLRWSTGLIPKCLLGMNQLRTKTCKYRAFIIITELAYVSDAPCFDFDSDSETTARGHQSNIGECWTFFKIRNVFRYQPPTSESHWSLYSTALKLYLSPSPGSFFRVGPSRIHNNMQ